MSKHGWRTPASQASITQAVHRVPACIAKEVLITTQKRRAAIVGVYEWPRRLVPDVSGRQIKAQSIRRALDDAGLDWPDVDAVYVAGDGEAAGLANIVQYLGLRPNVVETAHLGGSSYEVQAAH